MAFRGRIVVVHCAHDVEAGAQVAAGLTEHLALQGYRVLVLEADPPLPQIRGHLPSTQPAPAKADTQLCLDEPSSSHRVRTMGLGRGRRFDILSGGGMSVDERDRVAWESDYDIVILNIERLDQIAACLLDVYVPVLAPRHTSVNETTQAVEFIRFVYEERDPDRLRLAVFPVLALGSERGGDSSWLAPEIATLSALYTGWLPSGAEVEKVLERTSFPFPPDDHQPAWFSTCRTVAKLLGSHFGDAADDLGIVSPGEFVRDLLGPNLDRLEERYEQPAGVVGLSTGLADLDRLTGGLVPGQLIVVGGGAGHGKTDLCLKFATEATASMGQAAIYLTLDASPGVIANRLLSQESRVATSRLRFGDMGEADWPRLTNGIGRMAERTLYVGSWSTATPTTVATIVGEIRSHLGGLDALVVIDPAHALTGFSDESVMRSLKRLAMDLDVVVVATCSTVSPPSGTEDKRPTLGDLLGPDDSPSAADLVLLLYRDVLHDPDSPDRELVEIHVAKQREGPVARMAAYCDPATGRITGIADGRPTRGPATTGRPAGE